MNSNSMTFRRSTKAYLRISFSIVVLLIMLAVCSYLFYESYTNRASVSNQFLKKWIVMLVLFSFLFFLFIGVLTKSFGAFLRVTSPITLGSETIKIGKDIFTFSEIEQIKAIVLDDVYYEQFSGASIILLNGETRFIIGDQFYKNEHILLQGLELINKRFLSTNNNITDYSQRVINKITPSLLETSYSDGKDNRTQQLKSETQEEKQYDFNIFTSITHLLLLVIIGMAIFGLFKYRSSLELTLASLAMLISFYYIAVRDCYYFIINDYSLQIKNKLLFGYSKIFILDNVKAAVIYQKSFGRGALIGIRIISNEYQSTFFASNPLRTKKWIALGKALRSAGITVINQWEKEEKDV